MSENLVDVNHIQKNPTFVEDYLNYLPEALRQELLSKFVQVEIDRFKLVDDTLYDLAVNRLISNASGIYLDDIGARIQVYRNGLDDNSYRSVLFLKTGEAQKHGTRPEIISVLRKLLGQYAITTYKGYNFRFDVAINSPCFDSKSTADYIVDFMPLVTDLRVVAGQDIPFGFAGDDIAGGFGSVTGENNADEDHIGGFFSLVYKSNYDI